MRNCLYVFVLLVLLLCLGPLAKAQTPGNTYQIGAGYSTVTGPTDNGTLVSFAKQFKPRVYGVFKDYQLGAAGSGVNAPLLNLRYALPISAILKPNEYFDGGRWKINLDGGMGVVRDPNAYKFAWNLGAGLDYQASPTVTIQLFEGDVIFSRYFPQGYRVLTNVRTQTTALSSGLKFNF